MTAEPPTLELGEVVDDMFRVRTRLGHGGGGQVYEADDLRLQRRVALKVARRGPFGDLLIREAVALASIRDPAIVDIHAVGRHGLLDYVAMERLYGVTLATHLERTRGDTASPIPDQLDRLIAICAGLRALHRGGLFHGDLKPANVVLAPDGRAVLLDLAAGGAPSSDSSPLRTPHYLAPELLGTGAPIGSQAADLYALGVIAHELVNGSVPFDGENVAAILYQHLCDEPPELTRADQHVSPELGRLVRALLAKDPADRPASAEVVLWRLRDVRHSRPVTLGRGPSLLIVDDDPEVFPVASAAARAVWTTVEIETASDGAEAMRKIGASEPDVILLDLVMPVMGGIELCTHLRGVGLAQRTQIVAIGARAASDDVVLLNQLGITRFVPKGRDFVERLVGVLGQLGLGNS